MWKTCGTLHRTFFIIFIFQFLNSITSSLAFDLVTLANASNVSGHKLIGAL